MKYVVTCHGRKFLVDAETREEVQAKAESYCDQDVKTMENPE